MSDDTEVVAKRRRIWTRLYHGETAFDFVGRARIGFVISAVVILAGLASLVASGLNFGIEFEGGTSWEVKAPGVSVAQAQDAVSEAGLANPKVQIQGSDIIRVQSEKSDPELQGRVTDRMAALGKVDAGQVSVNDVGPSWGKDVTNKARKALIVFFVLISAYIALRFEWKMAVAALAAVVHDIFVTVGVYSISGFEVTPPTVVAFLTILGYSLYDTIVVFDKVHENTRNLSASGRMTYSDAVNLSMNQTLMRSLNTSFVAILPILSILFVGAGIMGATTLKDFGLALLVGLITGAYSSIAIAGPVLARLKEREARYSVLRQRVTSKGGLGLLTPAAAAAMGGNAPGPKAAAGTGKAKRNGDVDDDVMVPGGRKGSRVPSVPASTASTASTASPSATATRSSRAAHPAQRPGAPRPRKKGKKR